MMIRNQCWWIFGHDQTPMRSHFTAIIEREDDLYVALCPELDIASQGETVSEARTNLREGFESFLETASEKDPQIACRARSTSPVREL